MNINSQIVWFFTLQGLIGNPQLSIEDVLRAADAAANSFESKFNVPAKGE